MKKALSLFLAVLMLFSCFAFSSSAVGEDPHTYYFGVNGPAKADQCVVVFNPLGGTFRDAVTSYDYTLGANPIVSYGAAEYSGELVIVPSNSTTMKGGSVINLPVVIPASASDIFVGWEVIGYSKSDIIPEDCKIGNVYAGGTQFILPSNCGGQILTFNARYTAGVAEEDTLTMIMGIMMKIFGALIGILMYQGDTEAGVALMEKVFGGLF